MCIDKSTDLREIAKVLYKKCAGNSKSIVIFTLPCSMMGGGGIKFNLRTNFTTGFTELGSTLIRV